MAAKIQQITTYGLVLDLILIEEDEEGSAMFDWIGLLLQLMVEWGFYTNWQTLENTEFMEIWMMSKSQFL